MGIQGLLPMLKDIQQLGHISEFRGKRLAVDAYVWLHKGAFGCAEQLVKGTKTTRFVDYAMHRVRLLRHFGIEPYVVFDGGPLPAKRGTEDTRAKTRAEHLAKAQSLESQGRKKEARECYTKCVDITPEMAFQLIKALRAENVEYVVAPYEADAQLCFLERHGVVDGIITEDSDLLVFGCRHVIFKLDGDGQCVSIRRDHFSRLTAFPMHGWSDTEFRRMAMLSGCDYLPSIPGIGIKTAHKLMRRYKTVERLLQSLRLEGSHSVPDTYAAEFSRAELAFVHQRVYDPALQRLVCLTEFDGEDEAWIGVDVPQEVARGMARGDLHPETREPIIDMYPDYKPVGRKVGSQNGTASVPRKSASRGPMDAFIRRGPPAPAPVVPKPIGTAGSGPSKLSDQSLYSSRTEAGPSRSKFFAPSKPPARNECEEAAQAVKEVMVWEEDEAENIPSPPVSVRSPSPMTPRQSSVDRSSPKLETQLTSPQLSRCSTPALSSPMRATLSPEHDTQVDVLVAETQASPPKRSFSRISSILVPATSPPGNRTPSHTSSDPIDVVTPPPFSPPGPVKRKSEEEEVEEVGRKERAKVIAAGWRAKYALDFPKPRSTRVNRGKQGAEEVMPSPLPVLSTHPANIPLCKSTPLLSKPAPSPSKPVTAFVKSTTKGATRVTPNSTAPSKAGWSSLEKFRFKGKVEYPL